MKHMSRRADPNFENLKISLGRWDPIANAKPLVEAFTPGISSNSGAGKSQSLRM
jgi:hypothetical protein